MIPSVTSPVDIATTIDLSSWRGRRIVVAMSGGVDSALAAALLHRAGAQVIGVHMRVWEYHADANQACARTATHATCCSPADTRDARQVADQLGFPFYAIDFEANFRQAVIEPFKAEYLAGRTPNPCINCNNQLKLGTLLAKARAYGAEAVATGHYGRTAINPITGRAELLAAADAAKDQTYYLYGLTQPQLSHLVMPLGGIDKPTVRALSEQMGLHLHAKPDSVDICFVENGDYRQFMRDEGALEGAELAGEIINTRGEVIGTHEGIHAFTIGQRKGMGIAAPRPLYVIDIDAPTRTITVGEEEATLASAMEIGAINWVGLAPQRDPFRASIKIRYRSTPKPATVYPIADGNDASREPTTARIEFDDPVRSITPGQAAVAYDAVQSGSVLMGGRILRRL